MNNGNGMLRKAIFEKWFFNCIRKNISGISKMGELYENYCDFSKLQSTIPFRRKYFSFLLKKQLLKDIGMGSIIIYYDGETFVKGITSI